MTVPQYKTQDAAELQRRTKQGAVARQKQHERRLLWEDRPTNEGESVVALRATNEGPPKESA